MEVSFDKAIKTVATLALCVIAVQLIPITRVQKSKLLCAEYYSAEKVVPKNVIGSPEFNLEMANVIRKTYGRSLWSHIRIEKLSKEQSKETGGYTEVIMNTEEYCAYFK